MLQSRKLYRPFAAAVVGHARSGGCCSFKSLGGMLYAIIAALERGDARSARQLMVPLMLAFSLALLLLSRVFQYGF